MPKLKIGSDGKSVASIELQQQPDEPATWEATEEDILLPSGRHLSVHCAWAESGVSFSASHGEAPLMIGLTTEGPFLIRYVFPDNDSFTVALVGERPWLAKK